VSTTRFLHNPFPENQPPRSDSDDKPNFDLQEEYFVDATIAAKFLHCSRKHLLKLSVLGKIAAYPLPGSGQRRTWRYLLSELRNCMLNTRMTGLGPDQAKAVRSSAGGSRKGGQQWRTKTGV